MRYSARQDLQDKVPTRLRPTAVDFPGDTTDEAASTKDMSVGGIELITRTSLTVGHPGRITEILSETFNSRPADDRNWSWGYLRTQFQEKNLEELYLKYQQRLQTGFFSVFLMLQIFLTLVHITVIIVTSPNGDIKDILPDICVYIVVLALFWPMVVVVFRERLVRDYPWVPLMVSCASVTVLIASDLGLLLYHYEFTLLKNLLRPAYATHTLLAVYVFLPLAHNDQAMILGATVTACHLVVLGTVVYEHSEDRFFRLAADAVFLLCLNGLGLYYRYMNEVTVRRTFLDRRACLESTFKLRYEKEQEDQLMLSILPTHIVADVKADIRKIFQQIQKANASPVREKPFSSMYVKEHHNVTILYADVVNYSKLTVSLPVNKLVETLNDLFGNFDEASEKHNVLRIKFLGDCYYCVAGVPESNPHHAQSCVDLGLDMIDIIRDVREERKLKQGLDMRIGIHSGSILSGLLGVCKWQYDIWSNDVVIANHMEQAGKAGKVHITKQTAALLPEKYKYYHGYGAKRNQLLAKYNIETFFIVPRDPPPLSPTLTVLHEEDGDKSEQLPAMYARKLSKSPRRIKSQLSISNRRNTAEALALGRQRRRPTIFMDRSLYRYQQTLKITDIYMAKAIKKMRYGVHERWIRDEGIRPLCLTFKDAGWELPYLRQHDPLFKYYVTSALLVLIGIVAVQAFTMPRSHWIAWTAFLSCLIALLLAMPFLWTSYLWNMSQTNKYNADDNIPPREPKNKIVSILFCASRAMVSSLPLRTLGFLILCLMLGVCSLIELVECVPINIPVTVNSSNISIAFEDSTVECISSWQLSQTCGLAVLMSFFFLKIHYQLKLLVGLIFVGVYTVCILILRPNVFSEGETWNPHIEPQIAHIMNISFLTFTLHFLDRQSEYMMRLDYRWKRQLLSEQEDAEVTRAVNTMLLQNILPVHVAKEYLDTSREHDKLFHEEYEYVAVMFASLTEVSWHDDENPQDSNEKLSLTLLNEIICDFDKLLFKESSLRVEKIKVAGWTYMAACGLKVNRRDSNILKNSEKSNENVVVVLTRFAAKMMKALHRYNRESFKTHNLRIGISHGPVTAGVVGSQKPLYDIWGDAVNMASRMDSTGIPGRIQVTPNTAAVLTNEGFQCEFRGDTWIKGKNEYVKTSFVVLDRQSKLVKIADCDNVSRPSTSREEDQVSDLKVDQEILSTEELRLSVDAIPEEDDEVSSDDSSVNDLKIVQEIVSTEEFRVSVDAIPEEDDEVWGDESTETEDDLKIDIVEFETKM